ncbi:MAG TPA: DsbA family protein, partial [Gemmatimonadaceae bacterium]
EPRLPSGAVATGGPFRGAADAPVTITEYSDFECPFCKAAEAGLQRLLEQRGKNVKLVFKHLPMQGHRQAFPAARAAVCAEEQGSFWPFHDALFDSSDLDPSALDRIASTVGLDRAKYEACMSSPRSQAKVIDDVNEAKRLGINGTPGFVINGRVRHGSMTFEELQKIVDDELNALSTESSLSSR